VKPGEIIHGSGAIVIESPQPTVELDVANTSDRAIQVTSHYHFFEANPRLRFNREAAIGMRLDLPAGTAVRFEPGETRTVRLRPFGGAGLVRGFHNLVNGRASDPAVREAAMARARDRGFLGTEDGA
jgi:urease subunit gamma/beta